LLYEPHTKKTFWCAHILHYSWINGLTVLFDFDIYSSAALQRLVSLNHAMLTPFGVSPISKKTFNRCAKDIRPCGDLELFRFAVGN
jgi:hypothetical protein